MEKRIVAALLIFSLLFCGLTLATILPASADELPDNLLPTKEGKITPLPSDIPIYPGFKLSKPVLAKDKNTRVLCTFIQSNRSKRARPFVVYGFYKDKLEAKGWQVSDPGGDSKSTTGTFKKGTIEINFACYRRTKISRESADDPRGAKIELTIPASK